MGRRHGGWPERVPRPKAATLSREEQQRLQARATKFVGESLILREIVERYSSLVDGKMMAQRNNLPLKYEPPAERGDEEIRQCNAECSQRGVL